jgi:ribonucleoside-diphosphate reductase alpha chain
MDAFATSVSIALQYGVPLEDLCRKFSHMRFEPSGFTNNKQIPIAKSMMDYIFRYLAIKFLDKEVETADPEAVDPNQAAAGETSRSGPASDASQGELDFGTMDEPTDDVNDELIGKTVEAFMSSTTATEEQSEEVKQEAQRTYQNQSDAPPCSECGSITVRNGSCYRCPNCGASTGCG